MNDLFKKVGKEMLRAVLSALLAWLGISSTGCLAIGDGANVAVAIPASAEK